MTKSLAEAAREYAVHGWPVFPCVPRGKEPATPKGFHDATTDVEKVAAWWAAEPEANIGFVPGQAGLVVIDLDGPEAETEAQALGLLAEPTLSVQTARGWHRYYRHPGGTIGNLKLALHIDTRADLGYVLLPPSVHPSGKRYRFQKGPVCLLPPTALSPNGSSAGNGSGNGPAAPLPEVIPEGQRNAALTSLAGSMRRRGASASAILAALETENQERCQPPLRGDEVTEIARSVSRYPPAIPTPTDRDISDVSDSSTHSVAKIASVASPLAVGWPNELALAARHGLVGGILDELEPQTEADSVAIVAQFLVAFGSAVGRGPFFRVESTRHHMNENVLLVGATGKGRKGTSVAHIQEIFRRADPTLQWRSGLSSGEGLLWHVRDPITRDRPVKDKGGHILDYEKEIVDSGVDDKRLLLIESEFASTIRVMARDGNTLSPIVRLAWDGGRKLETMTKNSAVVATDAHVSLIGHITSEELQRHLDRTELANGFLNRFLLIATKRSKVLPVGGHIAEHQLCHMGEAVQAVIAKARTVEEMKWDDEARARWIEVYEDLSGGRAGLFGAVVSRAEAHVTRLSCLYALIDESPRACLPHLEAALALWSYAAQSAEFIFGASLGDPEAERLLAEIRRRGHMDRTEIRDFFSRHRTEEQITAMLRVLEGKGLVFREKQPTEGRPREVWHAGTS